MDGNFFEDTRHRGCMSRAANKLSFEVFKCSTLAKIIQLELGSFLLNEPLYTSRVTSNLSSVHFLHELKTQAQASSCSQTAQFVFNPIREAEGWLSHRGKSRDSFVYRRCGFGRGRLYAMSSLAQVVLWDKWGECQLG